MPVSGGNQPLNRTLTETGKIIFSGIAHLHGVPSNRELPSLELKYSGSFDEIYHTFPAKYKGKLVIIP